jgi:hypothetical protein
MRTSVFHDRVNSYRILQFLWVSPSGAPRIARLTSLRMKVPNFPADQASKTTRLGGGAPETR